MGEREYTVTCKRGDETEVLTYDTEMDAQLGALGMAAAGYRTTVEPPKYAETGTAYLPDGWTGTVTGCWDCGNPAPDEPCKRHDAPDGALCQPCRLGQLYLHLFCYRCGAIGQLTWCRNSVVEWARITSWNDEDTPVINDQSWDSESTGGGDTWVQCSACAARLVEGVGYNIGT